MNRFKNSSISLAFATVLFATPTFAASVLKSVQVQNSNEISLQFDSKIDKNQIKTEFFRDIIQISIKDGSVYPAKIAAVNDSEITKVFAYQYTPNLIRARFSIKGNAEDFQNRVSIETVGTSVAFKIKPTSGKAPIGTPALKSIQSNSDQSANQSVAKAKNISEPSQGEKALLDQIIKGTPDQKTEPKKDVILTSQSSASQGKTLTQPKSGILSQFAKLFLWASLFVGMIVVAAMFFRKSKKNRINSKSGFLSKLVNKIGTKPNSNAPRIEVIANHYLGPKKSIAVVRVKDKTLVLGITDESINLITQMMDNDPLAEDFEDEAGKFLSDSSALSRPQTGASSKDYAPKVAQADPTTEAFSSLLDVESAAADHFGVRSRIKKKIEAMKQI
jgi:flagellar biosynthetic protein FliO